MKLPSLFSLPAPVLVLIISIASPVTLSAAVTLEYDYLTNGEVTGSLILNIIDTKHREVRFEYKDRGRGPQILEKITLGRKGELVDLEVTGHSYMGAPVNEHFSLTDGTASWQSTLEKGSTDTPGDAMYWAADGSVEQLAILVRQALLSRGHRLALLPSGQVSVKKIEQLSVERDGKGDLIKLYEVSGLDLEPRYIWLDKSRQLVAVSFGSSGIIARDLVQAMPALQGRIEKAQEKHLKSLSHELTTLLPDTYAITPVQLLDVDKGELLANRTVVVEAGLVAGIFAELPADFDGQVIDGQNQVLMPGLWDMHTHLRPSSGLLHIAAGVTTARDLGNVPARLKATREGFDSGAVIGPHVLAAGIVDGKSPFSAPIDRLAGSQAEALQLVSSYAALGYPQIKVYSSVDPAWLAAIAAQTHADGMRLSGHIPAFMTATQAVNDGYDEIQHINMLFLNFLAGPEDDTRTPLRFSLVAENAGSLDLDSAEVQAFIELLEQQQVVIDPTVAIFDNMFRHRSGQLSPSFAMVAGRMPPSVRRGFLAGRMDVNADNADVYAASARALLNMVYRLYKAGVPLVAGTDSMAGFGLHRELELYVEAGIPSDQVLRLATLGAAEVMRVAATTGSIAVGKDADMILVPTDPRQDISALRNTTRVFKQDRVWEASRLYEAVGIGPSD